MRTPSSIGLRVLLTALQQRRENQGRSAVRRAIMNELDALEAHIGYFSPGCGSRILFGELMRERDAELHAVLPFDEDDSFAERLTYGLPEFESWRQRYDELRRSPRVTQHFATAEKFLNDQVLHDLAGSFTPGLALTRAAQVGADASCSLTRNSSRENCRRLDRPRITRMSRQRENAHLGLLQPS
jgi:hypothetical protein